MALILPGNPGTNNEFRSASNPSLTGECAYIFKFRYTAGASLYSLWNSNSSRVGMQILPGINTVRIQMGGNTTSFQRDVAGLVNGTVYVIAATQSQIAGEVKFYFEAVQEGATEVVASQAVPTPTLWFEGGTVDADDREFTEFGLWTASIFSESNLTDYVAGTLDFSSFATQPDVAWKPVGDGSTYLPSFAATIGTNLQSHFQGPTAVDNFPFGTDAVAAPTISGPASTTEGAATVETGTLLNTVTTQSFITTVGGFSINQTIDAQTATTLDYDAESGVNNCVPGSPANGVPMEPTLVAAGITAYQLQQKADDGATPATANIVLNGEATHDNVQVMIATSNTTPGESVLGTNIIIVEDDMQYYAPKAVNGMNITWANDGTFTTDADQTEVITVAYFSPANGTWGCITLTITQTSVGPVVGDIINTKLSIGIGIGI